MSINFHANQYEQAFAPHRLQNWELPKNAEGVHPKAHAGFTRVKATDRGHLLPNIPKERSSPWGKFVGTWDMPKKIAGNRVLNPTARSEEALLKNKQVKEDSDVILSGCLKKCHTVEPLPVTMDTIGERQPPRIECQPDGSLAGPRANELFCPLPTTQNGQIGVGSQDALKWPKVKSPACRSPVNYASSPKPMAMMYAASPVAPGVEIQQCSQLDAGN